ncbi:hypothetical protein DL770_006296 [Monosporascus sp. CRB-9-2]|nr:hypothetical protein DL770_006296 [Monosporascus sp. CRB-9-2]
MEWIAAILGDHSAYRVRARAHGNHHPQAPAPPPGLRGYQKGLLLATTALLPPPVALARMNLAGCFSSETLAYSGASLIWYVPDAGDVCQFLDYGGGGAPPKTTFPGCPAYEGTMSYKPSYSPEFGASATSTAAAITSGAAAETGSAASGESTATATQTEAEAGLRRLLRHGHC